MTAGPVNRSLLESNYQNAGQVYDDNKTEGAFDVVADQIDDNWNYLAGLISGTVPNPQSMSRQAIINGNMDISQRGTSFSNPANGMFTLDHYSTSIVLDGGTNPTLTHTQTMLSSGEVTNSVYCYRITTSGAGTGYGANSLQWIGQKIERAARIFAATGREITVSFLARSSIPNKKIGIWSRQNYGTGGSPTASEVINGLNWTLTTSFQLITYTFTLNTLVGKTFGTNNDDYVEIALTTQWGATLGSRVGSSSLETYLGAGTIDVAQLQVSLGNAVLPFQPKPVREELRDCQRYYEKSFSYTVPVTQGGGSYQGASYTRGDGTSFPRFTKTVFMAEKRIPPTIITYNPETGQVNGNARRRNPSPTDFPVSAENIGTHSFGILINGAATALGDDIYVHWAADAEF